VSRTARLGASLGINLALTIGLLVAGRAAHSTSLVADAGHNLTDAMALVLALTASILAARPPSPRRTYGWSRASTLAALANGVVLVLVTASIGWLAVERLLHPRPIEGGVVLVAALISVGLNLLVVLLLSEHEHDLGVRSALVHAVGDTLSSAVVALAGLIALVSSGALAERVDPIATLVVAALIVIEALRVTGASLHVLLEGVPSGVDLQEVEATLRAFDQILDVHDLHVWSISSSSSALSVHLVVAGDASIESTRPLVAQLRHVLADRLSIDHATVELEAEGGCGHEHPC
jgi:cobalt-zinc-cadmium efflux system protein